MTAENSYIEVAVAIPVYHTFTYSVPQFLLPFAAAGKRVLVPFGQRRVTGYILGPSQASGCLLYTSDAADEVVPV